MSGYDHQRRDDGTESASSGGAAPGKRTLTQGLAPRRAPTPGETTPATSSDTSAATELAALDDPFGLHLPSASAATAPAAPAVDAAARAGLGDVSGVRLHDDHQAHAAADAHAARALTVGPDVYFGAGQYQPGAADGDRLLGHELAHASQQRASGTTAIAAKLRTSEPGAAAEVEADRAGDVFAAAMTGAAVAPVTVTAAPVSIARSPLGQSRPLDPLGQSRPLAPDGRSFADPSVDADDDGRADPIRAPAPRPKAKLAAPLGQSRALDPRGQSHAIALGGQSFADPSRDQDGDGRADPVRAPSATDASRADAPTARPSAQAAELAAIAQLAIEAAATITTALLPTYAAALDALDLSGVHAAAVETIGTYKSAAEVRDAIRARVAAAIESPELAADHGLLAPIGGALDAALAVAEAALATGLGVQRFRGQAVMPGGGPIRLGGAKVAAGRLLQEAGFAEALIATVHEVVALVPTAAAATAEGVSIRTPTGASTAAAKVQEWAGRPVHFAFLRAALSALGVWSQIEHANIAGDLRTLGQLGGEVERSAARFGAMNDVGRYDASLAASLLLGTPSRENAALVLGMVESAAPDARGPILEDLQRRGVLDGFAARLSYKEAERLHDSVRDAAGVRDVLRRRYGDDPRTGDNTVSSLLGRVPLVGGGLRWVGNVATFGFMEEHDAAHRAMTNGEITDGEYAAASWKALARAGAVAVVSTATGGAAGSYVEGLTASLAARGVAGRIAANTAVGLAGGAAGNVGARAGSDLVDGEISGGGAYAHDALVGGAFGGGLGLGLSGLGAAAARYVPEHLKTPIHRLVERFPAIADDSEIFGAIRSLGERHSQGVVRFTGSASKVLRLAADGVVVLGREVVTAIKDPFVRVGNAARDFNDNLPGAGPQLVGAGGGGGSFTFTAEAARPLHVPGPDGPALHAIKAERIGDDLAASSPMESSAIGGDAAGASAPRDVALDAPALDVPPQSAASAGHVTEAPRIEPEAAPTTPAPAQVAPRPTRDLPHRPLTPREEAAIIAKVQARTATAEEWQRLQFHRRFKNRRARGVDRFWAEERRRLRAGEPGTRNWTPEQRADILAKRTPRHAGDPVEGHHMHNAADYPDIADNGGNIYPATRNEHLHRWHGGDFQNDTTGGPLAPDYPEEF